MHPNAEETKDIRTAVALSEDGGVCQLSGPMESCTHLTSEEALDSKWICEPDPAVIRAGLTGLLASQEQLRPLGPDMVYLGGEERPVSPLLRSWRVLDHSVMDRKHIRTMLRSHDIGPITVKKRGHPDTAADLERRFAGSGPHRGLLLVSRTASGYAVFLLEEPTG